MRWCSWQVIQSLIPTGRCLVSLRPAERPLGQAWTPEEPAPVSTASLGEPGEEEMGGKRGEAKHRRPVTDAIRSSGRSPLPGSASERGSVMGTANVYIKRPAGSPVHVEEAPAAGQRMMLSTGAARSWIPNLYLFILLFFASSCHVLHAQGQSMSRSRRLLPRPLASLSPPQTQPHSLSLLLVRVVMVVAFVSLPFSLRVNRCPHPYS
ncbi:unnamed protein product [Gadus morhua 'NCC']